MRFRKQTRCGYIRAGTKLPPQQEIADYLDANLSTVTKAYNLCREKGLLVTLLSLFAPGDCIAVDEFTYASLIEMARMMRIHLIAVEADCEGMRPDALQRKCAEKQIKGVYLMPSCTNPTTVVLSEKRCGELAAVIRDESLLLIEDDIASWLRAASGAQGYSLFDLLEERCVYICGMSKSLCPGVRVAFLSYSEDLKAKLQSGIFNLNVKTSSLDAEVITEILNSGDALRLISGKYNACKRANALYEQYFPAEIRNDVCFFRWLPIPSGKTGTQVEAELLHRGVRVFHSDRFMAETEACGSFLRISLGAAGNMHRLARALRILKAYIEEFPDDT